MQKYHPLSTLRERIVRYMYRKFANSRGNPIFSVYDNLSPVVTVKQNYDSLLVPAEHPSRKKSDAYYLNGDRLLRAHTSAHQCELMGCGLDNFLILGDCYRRDEIDASHYPVFHQAEAVRLLDREAFCRRWPEVGTDAFQLFENGERTTSKQAFHKSDVAKLLEIELKDCLLGLARDLFGQGMLQYFHG